MQGILPFLLPVPNFSKSFIIYGLIGVKKKGYTALYDELKSE